MRIIIKKHSVYKCYLCLSVCISFIYGTLTELFALAIFNICQLSTNGTMNAPLIKNKARILFLCLILIITVK